MFLKDFLFPKVCVGCGFVGSYICLKCQKKIVPINEDRCIYCGKISKYGLTHYGCQKPNGIDGVSALYKYNGLMQKIIKAIKYRLVYEVWKELCTIISVEAQTKWKDYGSVLNNPILQPIPLFPAKERQRGFNQAELVARLIKTIIDGKIINKLKRCKNTMPQAEQKENKNRYLNIKNAFRINRNDLVLKHKIIIIDDVFTSGATMKEAARTLKQAGAFCVYGMVLAKS